MSLPALSARHLLADAGGRASGPARLTLAGGRIAAVEPIPAAEAPDHLVMPVLVNAHDHARPVRSSSLGAGGKPLEIWLHYLALLPALDPYAATATSLARSALGGCGVVMIHHTRVQGSTDLPAEAAEMARAARDVGVKVGFAVALKDRNPLTYGPPGPVLEALPPDARRVVEARLMRPPLPVDEQVALVEEVAQAAEAPGFNVQLGPTGVQWCSPELLRAVAGCSERTGRRVHMHCLETRYQREWADRGFPGGMLPFLDGIGLLTDRLTLAHCTWARPAELDLLAARGVTISVSTSSNLGLRSGVAPVADMVRRGCRVAMGLDGLALDEDDDALRELRLMDRLHGGVGFEVGLTRAQLMAIAFGHGRSSVLGPCEGGKVAPGQPADLLVLDWSKIDDDRFCGDIDPIDLLLARSRREHVHALIVDGRAVVAEGRLTGIDVQPLQEALSERIRGEMHRNEILRVALPLLEQQLHRMHLDCGSCG